MNRRFAKIVNAKFTDTEQGILNVVGALIVVVINTCINFFLSPFITKYLGVEANGYITLANNFISYFTLITTALDSMAGRFMMISIRRNNYQEANEYYSSVLFGDWMLSAILFLPCFILIFNLERFIQINPTMLTDVKVLFSLVFLNFFIGICVPKWSNAAYSTNRLYLRSMKSAVVTIVRATLIFVLYKILPPYAFFVAAAGVIATLIDVSIEHRYKMILLPQLHIRKKYYDWKKIKILVSSGIWNTISQCGNILLEGLDVLVANLLIDPIMSGVLALSKIIPNMINQISGTVGTTFGPRVTALYAEHKYDAIAGEVKKHIKVVSTIVNIPIGITFVLGTEFFHLWVPTQDARQLSIVTSLTLVGMLFSGVANCILNIFTATNKLKFNSVIVIVSGLINVLVTYTLVKVTNLGIYAIAGVSAVLSIFRIFLFVAPYAAKCVGQNYFVFILPLLKAGLNVLIPIVVGFIVKMIPGEGWLIFLLRCAGVCILSLMINFFVVSNKSEQREMLRLIRR